MEIIALSGWRGAGKDTVADHLVRKHGYIQLSFASVLKQEVSRIYDIPEKWCSHPEYKNRPLEQYPVRGVDAWGIEIQRMLNQELRSGYWTPRALCILEGSGRRTVDPNYWVNEVAKQINDMPIYLTKFVISDLRFQSEVAGLHRLIEEKDKLEVWRVNRQDDIDTQTPSERDMDKYKFDVQLRNHGSLKELYKQIDVLMSDSIRSIRWNRIKW